MVVFIVWLLKSLYPRRGFFFMAKHKSEVNGTESYEKRIVKATTLRAFL